MMMLSPLHHSTSHTSHPEDDPVETTTTTTTCTKGTTTILSTPLLLLSSSSSWWFQLPGIVVHEVSMPQHRPLGCVMEESLATTVVTTNRGGSPTSVTNGGNRNNNNNNNNNKIVFIASVTSHGNAEQAGLLPGDVLVGISNPFVQSPQSRNEECQNSTTTTISTDHLQQQPPPPPSPHMHMTDVTGWGIEKVYVSCYYLVNVDRDVSRSFSTLICLCVCLFVSLVSCSFSLWVSLVAGRKKYIMCRYDPDPFRLRVVRGTSAWADHEAALTELCSNPDATATETDQCLLDYLQSGYDTTTTTTTTIMPTNSRKTILNTDDHPESQNVTCPITDDDDDDECVLVNDLQNLWASDLPIPSSSSTINDTSASATASSSSSNNSNSNTAKKPWSSRASPSGTFVRDPTTGRMKNLDL
jgi:hypothetical protein